MRCNRYSSPLTSYKLCTESDKRLTRVTEVLVRVQRQLDLFTRCRIIYKEEREIKPNMVAVLEQFEAILIAIVTHMHRNPNGKFFSTSFCVWQWLTETEGTDAVGWVALRRDKLEPAITAMGEIVKHLHDIAAFSSLRGDRETEYVKQRKAGLLQLTEHSQFPCIKLPYSRFENFWGRDIILEKIDQHLNWQTSKLPNSLRTFIIYGRRGVGKTWIALEYAYQSEKQFDAIFWIQCETAASLRISYTNMAIALKLPGAIQGGPHEDNLRLCHDWLRKTGESYRLQTRPVRTSISNHAY
jgi:hypothetical protein